MKLADKYELLEPVVSGTVELFVASETDSGLRRLVFFFAAADSSASLGTREILQRFRAMAPDPPSVILDVGQDQGSNRLYLVTGFPSDALGVQAWVRAYRAFSGQSEASRSEKASDGRPADDRLENTSQTPIPAASSAPSPSLGAPTGSNEPSSETKPGEFTHFFGASFRDSSPAAVPATFQPTGSGQTGPGEFTRMFGSQSTPAPPEAGNSSGVGQASEQEAAPTGSASPAESARATNGDLAFGQTPSLAGNQKTAREFTTADRSGTAIPEPMWGKATSERRTGIHAVPGQPQPKTASPPSLPAKPSEYTRIVSGGVGGEPPASPGEASREGAKAGTPLPGSVPPLPTVPAAPAKPSAPAPKLAAAPRTTSKLAKYWPLILILNVVLVAAIALVLYFALKPR
jgi:hypothetical protein